LPYCTASIGSRLVFFLVNLFFSTEAYSQQKDSEYKEKLAYINRFASDMCSKVPLSGSSSNRELTLEGKAEVDALIKKLGSASVDAKYQDSASNYSGVLQKDLAGILQNSINCKKEIATLLITKLIGEPSQHIVVEDPVPVVSEEDRKIQLSKRVVATSKYGGLNITYYPVVTTYMSYSLNLPMLFENKGQSSVQVLFCDGYAVLVDYAGEKTTSGNIDGVKFNGNGRGNVLGDGAKLFHNEATAIPPGASIRVVVHFNSNGRNKSDVGNAFSFTANLATFDGRKYEMVTLSSTALPMYVFAK